MPGKAYVYQPYSCQFIGSKYDRCGKRVSARFFMGVPPRSVSGFLHSALSGDRPAQRRTTDHTGGVSVPGVVPFAGSGPDLRGAGVGGKRMMRNYYHLEQAGRERLAEMLAEYEELTAGVFAIIHREEGAQ